MLLSPFDYYKLNFKTTIPTSLESFLKQSMLKKFGHTIKMYKRFLYMIISGQFKLLHTTIPENTKRILWLNYSSTSIGDSIMELSGRCLLRNKFKVDILTDKQNYLIYTEDDIFANVYCDINKINPQNYDFILVDIYNTKSMNIKNGYFKTTNFAGIQEFFYGLDFNRMLFSYHRVNALLNYPHKQSQVDELAKNYLHMLQPTTQNPNQIVIAVGGEDPIRTYNHWDEVIFGIIKLFPEALIILVGSQNGLPSLTNIKTKLNKKYKSTFGQELQIRENQSQLLPKDKGCIISYVNCLSLKETTRLISGSGLFIGADGGLMHIAESFGLSGVVLFAKFNPKYRLAYNSQLMPLSDAVNVSNIPSQHIINKIKILIGNTELLSITTTKIS